VPRLVLVADVAAAVALRVRADVRAHLAALEDVPEVAEVLDALEVRALRVVDDDELEACAVPAGVGDVEDANVDVRLESFAHEASLEA
jgi:hypothetical protein